MTGDTAFISGSRFARAPVCIHPERYYCVQRSPELAELWAQNGCVLQINKGSLLGELGEGSFVTASMLLRRGVVSVIASDAHHFRYRTPQMHMLPELLLRRFPEVDPELLLRVNPLRIAEDFAL